MFYIRSGPLGGNCVDRADRFTVLTLLSEFQNKKHFGSLDGLRALSILGVVWHHAARGRTLPFAEEGAMGVPLFFAISGFLITTLLLRERERTGDISLGAFYARRSLRIFPLYYTVLAVYVAVVALVEKDPTAKSEFFANLIFYATYTSNWFVHLNGRTIFYFAWSLATEEQFYLVWPSIEKFLGRSKRHLPAALALLLVVAWLLVQRDIVKMDHGGLARTMVLSIAPAICLGVIVAHLLNHPRAFALLTPVLGLRGASVVLLAAVIACLLWGAAVTSFVFMALLVAACVVREDHWLAPILRSRPLVSIGQVSYGIYLMHMLVVNVVEKVLAKVGIDSRAVVFPAAFFAVWGVAWLSFRYFESIFLRFKHKFAR